MTWLIMYLGIGLVFSELGFAIKKSRPMMNWKLVLFTVFFWPILLLISIVLVFKKRGK